MKQTELKEISERYSSSRDNVTLEFNYKSETYNENLYVWVVRTLTGNFTAMIKGNGVFANTDSANNVADLINNKLMLTDNEFTTLKFINEFHGWLPCE